jgi:hypothetical protein
MTITMGRLLLVRRSNSPAEVALMLAIGRDDKMGCSLQPVLAGMGNDRCERDDED